MSKYQTELPIIKFDENGLALSYGWVQVYHANRQTLEYTGTSMEYVTEGFKLSEGAYLDAPVLPDSNDYTVYRTIDGTAWEYVPDSRVMKQYQIELPTVEFDENGFALSYGWVQVYHINEYTREYRSTDITSVLVGTGLSAGSYLDKPELPNSPDMAICRSADGKSWIHLPDFRSKIAYNTQTRRPVEVKEIGELPLELTLLKPLTQFDKWDGKQWVTDTVAQLQYEIQQAEDKRQTLLDEAVRQVTLLERQKRLKLLEWDIYSIKLLELDISTTPKIDWPKKPE